MNIDIRDQSDIVKHYGIRSQLGIAQEECAELIQAISKVQRHTNEYEDLTEFVEERRRVVEEMADVIVCMNQLQYIFLVSDEELSEKVDRKIARQISRMLTEKTQSKNRMPFG